jgi:hypothetical protein
MGGAAKEKGKGKEAAKVNLQSTSYHVRCGVKANYDLVPLELGIGHYCGHMVDYDEVGYCCEKHAIVFFSFAKSYYLIFFL